MRRRTFLASSAALLTTSLSTPALGSQTADSARSVSAEPYDPLGHVGIENAYDAVVDSQTAYVAAGDGFVTVDVSDPTTPQILADKRDLLADVEDGPMTSIFDLSLDGDRLVVGGPANTNPSVFNGFAVFDISDPAAPERIAVHATTFPIHNLTAVDGRVYLTGNNSADNPVVVVDITGPEPVEVGRWSILDYDETWEEVSGRFRVLHDLWVQGEFAYLAYWDAGTWIVDISDPSDISFVARVRGQPIEDLTGLSTTEALRQYLQLPGNDHYVTTNEDATLLAIGSEAWDQPNDNIGDGPGGIELYDISTKTEPRLLSTIDAPPTENPSYGGEWTTAHNFDFSDGRLYSSWYRGGIRVHDVTDPADPRLLAGWEDRDAAEFFTAQRAEGRPFVVASSLASGSGSSTIAGALYTFPVVDDPSRFEVPNTPTPTVTEPTTTVSEPTTADSGSPPTTASAQPSTATTTPVVSTPADSTTVTPTTTVPTETTAPTRADSTTASGSGPGFGIAATLSALAAGGWYLRRNTDGEDE